MGFMVGDILDEADLLMVVGMLQKVVEALMIILALFELLYLLSLHLGFGRAGHNNSGVGYNNGAAGAGIGMGGVGGKGGHNHNHHTDYGHHTDMRIPVGHVPNPAHPNY